MMKEIMDAAVFVFETKLFQSVLHPFYNGMVTDLMWQRYDISVIEKRLQ